MTSTKEKLKEIQDKMKGTEKPVSSKEWKDGAAKEKDKSAVEKFDSAATTFYTKEPKVEKVEKTGGKTPGHGSLKDNGGARRGSGRKPLAKDEARKTIKHQWEDFASEEIEVTELHKGTKEMRKVKMARLRVAQEKLFKKVQEGDVSAIREFNDRVGGKAPQTLRGGDEDDTPIQIELGVDRMLDKVYGEDDE